MNNFEELQLTLGYKFQDVSLLETAMIHQSYANDLGVSSYERLEFLGDAVIELVVSDYIYHFCEFDAGVSTKLRANLVSTDYLSRVAMGLGLVNLVKKSKSLSVLGKKNTADIFESLIGAVYLDSGLDVAKKLINKYVIISEDNVRFVMKNCIDYKSKFQELMQAEGKSFNYKVLSSEGLDHEKVFEVGLFVDDNILTVCKSSSIHSAEEKCAEYYINTIKH